MLRVLDITVPLVHISKLHVSYFPLTRPYISICIDPLFFSFCCYKCYIYIVHTLTHSLNIINVTRTLSLCVYVSVHVFMHSFSSKTFLSNVVISWMLSLYVYYLVTGKFHYILIFLPFFQLCMSIIYNLCFSPEKEDICASIKYKMYRLLWTSWDSKG